MDQVGNFIMKYGLIILGVTIIIGMLIKFFINPGKVNMNFMLIGLMFCGLHFLIKNTKKPEDDKF